MSVPSPELTQILKIWKNDKASTDQNMEQVIYDTLRRVAHRYMNSQPEDHTLQATILANDAYLKLSEAPLEWADSAHFRATAATIMRRILIDYAREKNAQKRGGGNDNVSLCEKIADESNQFDVIELDQLLAKMAEFDERKAKVIELSFFGGLKYDEVADVLEISKATVERELRIGKAWLYKEMVK